MLLDCRASESEIAAHSLWGVRGVRSHIDAMFTRINTPHTGQELQGALNGLVLSMGAKPLNGKTSLQGALARYQDPMWWRRNLRVQLLRENESCEHAAGHVRRSQQCYVSNYAMKVKRMRAKASREVLERLEVVNELGEAFNLAEVADSSVSNPKLRRAELMVRCRGFEEVAELMGHKALFITITCPSRYHRFSKSGRLNPKWDGATPKDGQDYLNGIWKKIRAAWGNRGFFPYGFRVCEPHHDGCPHWHILLFFKADMAGWFVPERYQAGRKDYGAGAVGVAGAYAMKDSPNEPGAKKHRFTVEVIEPERGSATGYIAKYICKNIDGLKEDGEAVGLDFASGTSAEEAAKRVRVWASTWGIRQFQPVGGPSVTVWREVRRLSNQIDEPLQLQLFEGARNAADEANWMVFWLLQGGPDVRRKDLKLKLFYVEGECGKYGDAIKRVKGIQGEGQELETRLHTWTVQRQGLAEVDAYEVERKRMREILRKAFGVNSAYEFERIGEAERTWTGVNNCTDLPKVDESGADLAGFEAYMRSVNGGKSPQPEPLRS